MKNIEKLQQAISLIKEVSSMLEEHNYNAAVLVVFLMHNGGSITIDRIPAEFKNITVRNLLQAIEDKRFKILFEFDRLKIYEYGNGELIPVETWEELDNILNAEE